MYVFFIANEAMKNIMILDDHSVVLAGIETVFAKFPSWNILRQFTNPKIALSFYRGNHASIYAVILDIDLPDMDAFTFIEKAKRINTNTKFLLFSLHGSKSYFQRAVSLGVQAFILKSESVYSLPHILEQVAKGTYYYSPELRRFITEQDTSVGFSSLQMEILKSLNMGQTAKEIALELNKSRRTIEYHTAKLRKEYGVKNNRELVKLLRQNNVV